MVLAGSAFNTKNRLYIILYYTTHNQHRQKGLRARIQRKDRVLPFFYTRGNPTAKTAKTDRTPDDDNGGSCVSAQPSPELMNRVGHALLRAVAAGQGGPLQAAVGALDRLGRLLPDASAEGRLIAVLLAISSELTSQPTPTDQRVDAVPPQSRGGRQGQASKAGKTDKAVRPARKGKPTAQPILDAAGRLQASRIIGGIGCVSQATARQVLELTCPQMIKLENQRLLTRIQEPSSRLVFYAVAEVQHLIDKLDATPPPTL
jgi:hypothetical protein